MVICLSLDTHRLVWVLLRWRQWKTQALKPAPELPPNHGSPLNGIWQPWKDVIERATFKTLSILSQAHGKSIGHMTTSSWTKNYNKSMQDETRRLRLNK